MILDWTRRWTFASSFLLTTNRSCGDTLSPESAMPGAYLTPCALERVRYIPSRTATSNDEDMVLQIPQGTVGPGSTGAVVWNSGILMKRLVEELMLEKSFFRPHDSVLELGCGGTGLVSATMAKYGIFDTVVASDGNPDMIDQVKTMARLNNLHSYPHDDHDTSSRNDHPTTGSRPITDTVFHTAVYQWGSYDTSMLGTTDRFDWIVGADLTYNPASWLALADSMALLSEKSLYLTLGHGGSVRGELSSFLTAASDRLIVDVPATNKVRNLLLTKCIGPNEMAFVEENGGVSVVVLRSR